MPEKDKIYAGKIKHEGIFSFKDFYKFCHKWLTEESDLSISEDEYSEKIKGDSKEIDVKWKGKKSLSDYFNFEASISWKVLGLTDVEVVKDGKKIKTNKGQLELKMTANLVRDPKGKFETSSFQKFIRGIYEKWVITSRIEQMEEKLTKDTEDFLNQAKAWLDLEGKK